MNTLVAKEWGARKCAPIFPEKHLPLALRDGSSLRVVHWAHQLESVGGMAVHAAGKAPRRFHLVVVDPVPVDEILTDVHQHDGADDQAVAAGISL